MAEHVSYEQSGVNIELGDDLSKILYEAAKLTWDNRRGRFGETQELHESFSGFRAMPLDLLKSTEGLYMQLGADGVGTKVEVAERTLDHSTIAYDLFAMVCDDAVVRGAEPIAVATTLDVRKLDNNERTQIAISQLARGYVDAARESETVVVNGEVAELGDRVGGFRIYDTDLNYNWAATVLWLVHESRILSGRRIEPGHSLIGFAERGFRSNGLSLVRKVLAREAGEDWHRQVIGSSGATFGELVQAPSVIYSRFINRLTGGYDLAKQPLAEVSGIAHITGGGMPGKLKRLLEPSGYGAVIDSPMVPPEIMLRVQQMGGVSDAEAYKTWHMGPGMIITTPDEEKVLAAAREEGIAAQRIGQIARSPVISIESRGVEHSGRALNYFI